MDNEKIIREFIEAWTRLDPEELSGYFTDSAHPLHVRRQVEVIAPPTSTSVHGRMFPRTWGGPRFRGRPQRAPVSAALAIRWLSSRSTI